MSQHKPKSNRRRPTAAPVAEALEGRELLTGGTGNTFALFPNVIAAAGAPAEVRFTVDPARFVRPGGRIVLGVDVTAQRNSTVDPKITGLSLRPAGTAAQGAGRATPQRFERYAGSKAILATFTNPRRGPATPQNFAVSVQGLRNTSGAFLAGFYLPGDADGNGTVNQADIALIRASIGQDINSNTYDFDHDSDRNGRVTQADVTLARRNLGAGTNVTPVLSANLDPASDTGAPDRITTNRTVRFLGTATPAAAISYLEVAGKVPVALATADAFGNYSLSITLSPGVNTFRVTSLDSFGQVISGQISPVTFQG